MKTLIFSAILLCISFQQARAVPKALDPQLSEQIPLKFFQHYSFFQDDERPDLIYIVPRLGQIELRKAGSAIRPRFSWSTGIHKSGFFTGLDFVKFAGTFRADATPHLFEELQAHLQSKGKSLAYAPIDSMQAEILTLGKIKSPGDHIDCSYEQRPVRSSAEMVSVPICVIREGEQPLELDIFQTFALINNTGTSLNDPIAWSAITLPGWEPTIRGKLTTGDAWDELFILNIIWNLESRSQDLVEVEINPALILTKITDFSQKKSSKFLEESQFPDLISYILDCSSQCPMRWSGPLSGNVFDSIASHLKHKYFLTMIHQNKKIWIPKSIPLNSLAYESDFISEKISISPVKAIQSETKIMIHCLLNTDPSSLRVSWDKNSPACMEGLKP